MPINKPQTLNSRGSAFDITLNDSGANVFQNSRHIYRKLMCSDLNLVYCAVNYHDQDLDEEINQIKTPHYHVVITMDYIVSIKSLLKYLVDLFHCNVNQIGILVTNDVCRRVRYLCHLDDIDKYQYNRELVVSNCQETTQRYFNIIHVHDCSDLVNVVNQFPSRSRLMCLLEREEYHHWRPYIDDILKDKRGF